MVVSIAPGRSGLCFVGGLLVLSLQTSAAAMAEAVNATLTNTRGVNYVVPGSMNPIDQWLSYDAPMVETTLTTLDAFGVNGLRVFGSFEVWQYQPAQYKQDLTHLATEAFGREMLLMLVLFDSFGGEPSGDVFADAANGTWLKSPGQAVLGGTGFALLADQYILDTMTAVQDARDALGVGPTGQVVYDIWNEPGADAPDESLPGSLEVPYDEIAAMIQSIKAIGNERTTVGFVRVDENQALLDTLADPTQLDIISHHPYGIFEAVVQTEAARAAAIGGGRPFVATEVVLHGAFQDCAHVLGWLEKAGEGFFVWEAFASKTQFAALDGLFYEDPSTPTTALVRDLEGVNKLLSLAVKQGFVPTKQAVLKGLFDPGYLHYMPTPYAFTTPMAHDLLLNWNQQYGVVHPPLTTPAAQTASFYRLLFSWAVVSLDSLSLLSSADTLQLQQLQSVAVAAELAGDMTGVKNAYDALASMIAPLIVQYGLAEPLNTAPEVVYMTVSPTPLVGLSTLTIDLLVNDADRNTDIAFVALFDMIGWDMIPLTDQGGGLFRFSLPGVGALPTGLVIGFLGGVIDMDGATGTAVQTLSGAAP